jgi:hypothetical protein
MCHARPAAGPSVTAALDKAWASWMGVVVVVVVEVVRCGAVRSRIGLAGRAGHTFRQSTIRSHFASPRPLTPALLAALAALHWHLLTWWLWRDSNRSAPV